MDIKNEKLMRKCFPKHLRIGTAKLLLNTFGQTSFQTVMDCSQRQNKPKIKNMKRSTWALNEGLQGLALGHPTTITYTNNPSTAH